MKYIYFLVATIMQLDFERDGMMFEDEWRGANW